MASQAIEFALDQGFKLFPVSRARKKPIIKHWPERATDNRDLIGHWSKTFPECNWAAETGDISNLLVIDIDGPKGRASRAELERKLGPLPVTLSQRTGRDDGGEQLCYQFPAGRDLHNSAGKIAPGIDVRAWRGFIVIPDSVHPTGRRYAWENTHDRMELDESWIDLIEQTWLRSHQEKERSHQEKELDAPKLSIQIDNSDADVQADHQPRHYGFRALLPGYRTNGLLHVAGKLRRKGASLDQITSVLLAQNSQRCQPPLPTKKVIAMAQDVVRLYSPVDGPDMLEQAWNRLELSDAATTAFKFRSLAAQLQQSRPNQTIVLPQERIAVLFGVDQRVISRLSRNMVTSGFLQPVGDFVPHVRAQAYRVLIDP